MTCYVFSLRRKIFLPPLTRFYRQALELSDEIFNEMEAQELRPSLPLFVLNPTSKRRIIWDTIITLLLMSALTLNPKP